MTEAKPYSLSVGDSAHLRLLVEAPAAERRAMIDNWISTNGGRAVLDAFAEFIGLADSVVGNAREMVELVLIVEGGLHPHTAEKVNLPTVAGALNGVALAEGIDEAKLCAGCAFRIGTPANQSPITTGDAAALVEPSDDLFLCHEHLDEQGQPTKACAGFAQARRAARRGA